MPVMPVDARSLVHCRIWNGERERHELADGARVWVTAQWDTDEVVQVKVEWNAKAAPEEGAGICYVAAHEANTWLSLRWPDHFARDGSCRCGECEAVSTAEGVGR